MNLTSAIRFGWVAVVALASVTATGVAFANHFILPCNGDCARGAWVATQGMRTERQLHTATLLPNGKVLVAGGRKSEFVTLRGAELYDPATSTWTETGPMTRPRAGHTATLLRDGRVLVAGGTAGNVPPDWGVTSSSELYDPATATWTPTGAMSTGRFWFDATLLPDGRVLVAGGYANRVLASAELFDPATGRWSPTGSLNVARYGLTLTTLADGTVLGVRGSDSDDLQDALKSTERYDPTTGTWQMAGDAGVGSVMHTATRLPNGRVLIAGGNGGGVGRDAVYALSMLYDPETGAWTQVGDLPGAVYDHAATVLVDGQVLIAGGTFQTSAFPTLRYEFTPSAATFGPDNLYWQPRANVMVARGGATMTALPDGTVLLAGGYTVDAEYRTTVLSIAERFLPDARQIKVRDVRPKSIVAQRTHVRGPGAPAPEIVGR
jgi:N-acetylneuraminic acid mutarotase